MRLDARQKYFKKPDKKPGFFRSLSFRLINYLLVSVAAGVWLAPVAWLMKATTSVTVLVF